MIITALFLLVSFVIIIFVSRGDGEEDSLGNAPSIEELRKRQIQGLRENAIKVKFEENIQERVGRERQKNTDDLLMKAGLDNWRYTELVLIKISLAIVGLIVSWLFLKAPVITVVTTGIMYILPGQIVQTVANKRMLSMEEDVGTFIQLVIERYKVHGDFQEAIKQSAPDFKGQEPMYSEIRKTILDLNIGRPTVEAVDNMSKRTGNRFLKQLANYYDIASTIGTESSRNDIIGQAWINYQDDYNMRKRHEEEINGPKKDAFIIVGALPLLMVYQSFVDEHYLDFYLNTKMGQIGLAVILVSMFLAIMFINKKIGAPLD